MDQELKSHCDDNFMDSFKLEFIKTLQELQIKKQQLEEYRSQMAESILKQHELEHKLENETRKNATDQFNNILMKNGNDALETERQSLSRELAIYRSRNDIYLADRDSLYTEARVQTLDNLKLKETIKDLERKHQCHLLFQDGIKEKMDKTVSALKAIMPSILKIQQKQENILEMFDDMNKFESLRLTVRQLEKLTSKVENERDFFENKFITENAECLKLRELLDNLSMKEMANEETKLTSLWKEQALYLQTQLKKEKERNEMLEDALRVAMENEIICRKANDDLEEIEINETVVDISRQIQTNNVAIQTDVDYL